MNKKLFHIEFKNTLENKKHFYYGDLTILCNTHEIGISKFTLDRWSFETPFDNEICIIRKSKLVTSKRSVKLLITFGCLPFGGNLKTETNKIVTNIK